MVKPTRAAIFVLHMRLRISKESIPVVLVGVAFVLAAVFMPQTVHIEAAIPAGSVSSPEKPLIIARWCCFLDGLWCLFLSLSGFRWKKMDSISLIEPKRFGEPENISRKVATWGVVAIAAVGLILRSLYLNNSFWLDEITPLTFYRDTSVYGLLTTYFSTNNHLLYTLLEKLSVSSFGEQEWAVRLPSVLLGAATIPTLYLLTRVIAPRSVALGSALLLAVNYQHIFFSQNARGYTAHVLFSLAATLFLIRGIKKDKISDWVLFCFCQFFNLASIIASLSVLIAHFAIGVVAAIVVEKRSKGGFPLFRRIFAVCFIALLMVLHLYSIIFPQAYGVVQNTYHVQSTGFTLFSAEFLNEILRGFKVGVGPLILLGAIPALVVGLAGVRTVYKCSWILLVCAILPEIFLALYLLKLNLAVSPRFFLLALPFVLLVGSVGIYAVLDWLLMKLKQRKLLLPIFAVCVLAGSGVGARSLMQYYKIPKQDFRTAVEYLKTRPVQIFPVSIYTAREGFAYYASKIGWQLNRDYFDARTASEFADVLKHHNPRELYLVTTFPRALHLDHPELEPIINEHWVVDRVFPGSIGDGDLTVWKPRP